MRFVRECEPSSLYLIAFELLLTFVLVDFSVECETKMWNERLKKPFVFSSGYLLIKIIRRKL